MAHTTSDDQSVRFRQISLRHRATYSVTGDICGKIGASSNLYKRAIYMHHPQIQLLVTFLGMDTVVFSIMTTDPVFLYMRQNQWKQIIWISTAIRIRLPFSTWKWSGKVLCGVDCMPYESSTPLTDAMAELVQHTKNIRTFLYYYRVWRQLTSFILGQYQYKDLLLEYLATTELYIDILNIEETNLHSWALTKMKYFDLTHSSI